MHDSADLLGKFVLGNNPRVELLVFQAQLIELVHGVSDQGDALLDLLWVSVDLTKLNFCEGMHE